MGVESDMALRAFQIARLRADTFKVLAGTLVAASALPDALAAQTTMYDAGYVLNATRDYFFGGPVSVADNRRFSSFPPLTSQFTHNSIGTSLTEHLPDGTALYFGSASALAEGQAGDRYVKGKAAVQLDFTTGSADAQSIASWNAFAVAGGNAQADLSLYVERTLSFSDFFNSTDHSAAILANALANPPAFSQQTALSLAAGSLFSARITEIESGNFWFASRQDDLIRQLLYLDPPDSEPIIIDQGDRAYSQFYTISSIDGVLTWDYFLLNQSISLDGGTYPPSYSFSGGSFLNLDSVFLQYGMTYNLELYLGCSAGVTAHLGLAAPSTYQASCTADNSGYWLGFDNYRDNNGNPIAPISFTSTDTGIDLAAPSPFAPDLGGGVVPEPASWAMLIAGFGLVGWAMRRRRLVAA
jgi:hypothetical protein